jgi:hypothetical protein
MQIIPSGAQVGAQFVLEVIQLAGGYTGWLRRMGLESGNWNCIAFQLQVGGAPLRDFTVVKVPIGSPSTPEDVYLAVAPNVVTQLVALVIAVPPAAIPLRWYLGGWYYQES